MWLIFNTYISSCNSLAVLFKRWNYFTVMPVASLQRGGAVAQSEFWAVGKCSDKKQYLVQKIPILEKLRAKLKF